LSDSLELAQLAASVIDENKAEDLVILDVQEHVWITDYFILATGQSRPHIKFLQQELKKRLGEVKEREPSLSEGNADEGWLLVDYGDIIVHIFSENQREYYNLEGLWADAEQIPIEELREKQH